MSNRSCLRLVPLLVSLALGGSAVGCHKSKPAGPKAEEVRQSLDALKTRLDEEKKKYMSLRGQVEQIPPDLPDFQQARAQFYAAEEGRGVVDGKAAWLSGRLDAAAGNSEELLSISNDIAQTYDSIRQMDELHIKMLHQMMAFQRMAKLQSPPKAPAPEVAATPTKTKRSKSKP